MRDGEVEVFDVEVIDARGGLPDAGSAPRLRPAVSGTVPLVAWVFVGLGIVDALLQLSPYLRFGRLDGQAAGQVLAHAVVVAMPAAVALGPTLDPIRRALGYGTALVGVTALLESLIQAAQLGGPVIGVAYDVVLPLLSVAGTAGIAIAVRWATPARHGRRGRAARRVVGVLGGAAIGLAAAGLVANVVSILTLDPTLLVLTADPQALAFGGAVAIGRLALWVVVAVVAIGAAADAPRDRRWWGITLGAGLAVAARLVIEGTSGLELLTDRAGLPPFDGSGLVPVTWLAIVASDVVLFVGLLVGPPAPRDPAGGPAG